jgi:hypothetical protein
METTPSASHVEVPGTSKHVAFGPLVTSPVPVPSPLAPVTVVNDTEPPGITDFVSGLAVGGLGGAPTVGVIVAAANCPLLFATMYLIGVAVPENVDNGVNVTAPVVVSTVYVPSPGTVSESPLQLASAVPVKQNLIDAGTREPLPAVSPVSTSITCAVLNAPVEVSLSAVGPLATATAPAATVGVIVAEALDPKEFATTYLIGVAVPANVDNGVNVTTPVDVSTVYVPSPAMVSDVAVHTESSVPVVHSRTEDGINVAPVPATSPVSTSITCAVLEAPEEVSLSALGATPQMAYNVMFSDGMIDEPG